MLKKEFESLTGKTVSDEDFTLINRIYMAAGEMDKATFCKNWKPELLENPIVAAMTVGTETWIKAQMNTAEELNKAKKECSDTIRVAKGLQDQVNARERTIGQLRAAVDATVEQMKVYSATGSGSAFSNLTLAADQLRRLALKPEDLPRRLTELSTGSNSAARMLA